MGGRIKIPCYSYDSDGKYLRSYNSIAEAREFYYPTILGKVPMFDNDEEYMIMPNGDFVSRYRIGRNKLVKLERIRKCPYCSYSKNVQEGEIEVFNLKGEKIAEFKNAHLASILLNIDVGTLWNRIKRHNQVIINNKPNKDNLVFRFKS